MRGLFTKQSLALEAGQTASGVAGKAQTLRILRGRVWITVAGVSHDYWLSAGESFPAIPGSLIVVEADRDGSRVDVMSTRKPAKWQQFGTRVRTVAQRLVHGKASHTGSQPCVRPQCQQ